MRPDKNGCATCTQCGIYKNINEFRKYRGNRQAHYNYCKSCESINNRYKRLKNIPEPTEAEQAEVKQIEKLYETLKTRGFAIYGIYNQEPAKSDITDLIQGMLEIHIQAVDEIPAELLDLDKKDFSTMNEDELEDLQDYLNDRYCPIIRMMNSKVGDLPNRDRSIYDKYDGIFGRIMDKIDEALGY